MSGLKQRSQHLTTPLIQPYQRSKANVLLMEQKSSSGYNFSVKPCKKWKFEKDLAEQCCQVQRPKKYLDREGKGGVD